VPNPVRVRLGEGDVDVRVRVQMRVRDPSVLRGYISLVGLSERELARRAGISHSTLNHLLTGRRTVCTQSTARAVERALGCGTGVFFGRD
jgi:hypothetical protein